MTTETLQIRVNVDGQGRVRAQMGNIRGEFQQVDRTAERSTRTLSSFRTVLTTLGAGFTLRHVFGELGGFEQSMSRVRAVTQASDEDMADLQGQARQLGATTLHSGQEAAQGMGFLGQAGFDTNQILAAMPSTLDLATAGQMDLARAADISSNVLQAFRLEAAQMPMVADTLAAAAATTNTNIQQLGSAMQFVGPVAASLEIDIAQTAAAIGALSDAGIQGSAAGTGLRRVLSSLVNPSGAAAQRLEELGLAAEDVDPRANDLAEVLRRLRDAGLDASDAFQIFGDRGGPALLELLNQADKVDELTGSFRDSEGRAREMSDTLADNLVGSMRELRSAASENIQQLGDRGMSGAFRGLIDRGTTFLRVTADMGDHLSESQEQYRATIFLAENMDVILAALAATMVARVTPALLAKGQALLTVARNASIARGALAFFGGVPGIIAGAASALGMWALASRNAGIDTEDLTSQVDQLTKSMEDLREARIREAMQENLAALSELHDELEQLEATASRQSEGTGGYVNPRVTARLVEVREEIEQLESNLRRLSMANEDAADSSDRNTDATDLNTDSTDDNARAKRELASEVQRYVDSLEEEIATLGMTRAEEAAWRGEMMASKAATEEQAEAIRIRTATLIAGMAVQDEVADRERVLTELRGGAESTLASLMTAEERHAQQRAQLQEAFDLGLLDMDEAEFESQLQRLEDSFERTTENMTQYSVQAQRNIQNTLGNTLEEMMRGNFDNIGQMWLDLIIRMESQAMASRILGQDGGSGGFFSWIASAFGGGGSGGGYDPGTDPGFGDGIFSGGGRAFGGSVHRGRLHPVNERGQPEMLSVGGRDFLMMSGQDGRVTPNDRMGSVGGGGQTINHIETNVDARGSSDPAQAMRLRRELDERDRRLMRWVDDRMRGRAA